MTFLSMKVELDVLIGLRSPFGRAQKYPTKPDGDIGLHRAAGFARFLRLFVLTSFLFAARLWAINPVPYTEGVSFSFKITGVGGGMMTVTDETNSPVVSATTSTTIESSVDTAWLRPGKLYDVNFQASGPTDYWLSFIAPAGYSVYVDGQPTDLIAQSPGGGGYSHDYVVELRPVNGSARGDAGSFSGIQLGKSVTWDVGLGGLRTGRSAGRILFKEPDLVFRAPASRAQLYYAPPANVGQITTVFDGASSQTLRQIGVPQTVVDLVDDLTYGGYWIKFYELSQATWTGSLYTFTGSPWKTLRVESPAINELQITETEGAISRVSLLNLTSTSPTLATGGTVSYGGGYTIHTFTSGGTFAVSTALTGVEAVIVAGGGGGGGQHAGGGGAGGLLSPTGLSVGTGSTSVTVGAGGAGCVSTPGTGVDGGNSAALGYTAVGGGAGTGLSQYGNNGGSGGGDGYPSGGVQGGYGTSGQGNDGSRGSSLSSLNGGGGGGAGGVGSGANGGTALGTWAGTFAGGGGGGFAGGPGGGGGAGNGGFAGNPGAHATANSGSGGGGGGNSGAAGGDGGSGIVVIRYPTTGNGTVTSGVYTWQLQEGDGTTWLRTTVHDSTVPSAGVREEVVVVRTGGTSGTVVAKTKYRYESMPPSPATPWGEEVTQIVADPDTAALTTTYDYFTTSADFGNYRKVKSITSPTGSWVSYLYYDNWDRRGQLAIETRPWLDTHSTVQAGSSSVDNSVVHDYVADFTGRYRLESTQENRTTNVRTGYSTTSPTLNQTQDSLLYTLYQTDAYSATSSSQTAFSAVVDSGNGSNSPDYAGQPFSLKRPDGSQDSYTHHTGSFNYSTKAFTAPGNGSHFRTAVFHGTTNASGADSYTSYDSLTVAQIYLLPGKSTRDVTIRNPAGDVVRTETHVYTGSGSFTLLSYEDFIYDAAGRLTSRVASNSATVTHTYTNGRLTSTVGVDGTETQFTYDEIGRVATRVKKGVASSGSYAAQGDITATPTYDGAGHVVQTVTSGGALSLTASTAYDLAGRLTSSTAPGSYTTSFAYTSGGKIVTATLPGGATKITETYLDGQMKSVSGTAVVAEDYACSIDGSGNRVRNAVFGGNTSAASDTTQDWLGRTIQETKPGWSGSPVSRLWSYNSAGQLEKFTQPGLADTLYLYDTLGRLFRQGLDINANGALNLASDDRITESAVSIQTHDSGATWWVETESYAYATSGSGTPTLTGHTWARLNLAAGNSAESYVNDISGNRTYRVTTFDPANRKVITTLDPPDSTSNASQTAYNGLLVENADAAGLTQRYGYDALGRPTTSVDPRTGTTTTAYVSGTSQVYSVTDPASVVQAVYTYDSAGRVATVTDALSKVCRYAYTTRNEKYRVWGDTDYPVEYGYNALGQQTTMKTYRGGTGWNGGTWPGSPGTADTTTWAYQAATNLLSSKTDAASHAVTYTYTQASQVATREWARILTGSTHVTTTYGYDSATGELLTVNYNDSTADLTYTYNRLGQSDTVVDSAGSRTFAYNLGGTLELQHEELPAAHYANRWITFPYAVSGVIGRSTGLQLGTSGSPSADQSVVYTYTTHGRLDAIAAGGETFDYDYVTNSSLVAKVTNSAADYADIRGYVATDDRIDTRTATIGTGAGTVIKSLFAYGRDNLGRATQVAKRGEMFERYGNTTQGLDTYCGYNDRSEVTSEVTKLGSGSTVLTGRNDTHTYDPIGNRDTVTHNSNSAAYTTNALNQYTQRTVPGVFDVAGAAASAATVTVNSSSSGVTRHGDYFFKGHALSNNPNAVLTTLAVSDGTTTSNLPAFVAGTPEALTYDDDGNLLSDGRFEYGYDAENRPNWIQTSSAAGAAGVPVEADNFMYDYLGRRVLKARYSWTGSTWVQTAQERYLYNGWNLIAVGDASFNIVKNCYWGLDLSGTGQGAGGVGGLLMVQESGNSYLPMYDGLGNLHGMIQASNGDIVAAYEYDAFGQTLRESGPYAASNPFRYSTKYTDTETGLVYYGMRYYSPSLGRFINKDPIEEMGGLNLYGFCGNNGVNSVDLLGLDPWTAEQINYQAQLDYANFLARSAGGNQADDLMREAGSQAGWADAAAARNWNNANETLGGFFGTNARGLAAGVDTPWVESHLGDFNGTQPSADSSFNHAIPAVTTLPGVTTTTYAPDPAPSSPVTGGGGSLVAPNQTNLPASDPFIVHGGGSFGGTLLVPVLGAVGGGLHGEVNLGAAVDTSNFANTRLELTFSSSILGGVGVAAYGGFGGYLGYSTGKLASGMTTSTSNHVETGFGGLPPLPATVVNGSFDWNRTNGDASGSFPTPGNIKVRGGPGAAAYVAGGKAGSVTFTFPNLSEAMRTLILPIFY